MFAVYSPVRDQAAFVLTPDCKEPSSQVEREYGPLRCLGAVAMEVDLLEAIAEHRNDHNLEYVVVEPYGRRYVEQLVERSDGDAPRVRTSS